MPVKLVLFENRILEAFVVGWRERWCGAADEHIGKNSSAGIVEEIVMTLAGMRWTAHGDALWC